MPEPSRAIRIATRGSALALAQAHEVLARCRELFPRLQFELKIIKTTGDKLQTASLARRGQSLPKGLFTRELEVALLRGQADLAVHSLKDLPIELPPGLMLAAVPRRADVRDVLLYREAGWLAALRSGQVSPGTAEDWVPGQADLRGFEAGLRLADLPSGACLGTSSPRRQAQLRAQRSDLRFVELRGNVPTRLNKLATRAELDAAVLALAGLSRLNFRLTPAGRLEGDAVPQGLLGVVLDTDLMLPCVGQGAIGIEIRDGDERVAALCQRLNHYNTFQAVTAERAFLRAMGGGCHSPVAALAQAQGDLLHLRAVSFVNGVRRAEAKRPLAEAAALGEAVAAALR